MNNFQRFTDPHKYYDIPPCEPWMTTNIGPTYTPTPVTHNWQRPARNVKRPQIPYYPMEEGYPVSQFFYIRKPFL